jgi:hypothetical protein
MEIRAKLAPRRDLAAATNTQVSNTTRIGRQNYPTGCVAARMPRMQIQVPGARGTVGQFANCPTVSEGGRDADGKQRAGPDPSSEGQAATNAVEAGAGKFL